MNKWITSEVKKQVSVISRLLNISFTCGILKKGAFICSLLFDLGSVRSCLAFINRMIATYQKEKFGCSSWNWKPLIRFRMRQKCNRVCQTNSAFIRIYDCRMQPLAPLNNWRKSKYYSRTTVHCLGTVAQTLDFPICCIFKFYPSLTPLKNPIFSNILQSSPKNKTLVSAIPFPTNLCSQINPS